MNAREQRQERRLPGVFHFNTSHKDDLMPDEDKDKDPTAAFQSRLAKMNGDAMGFATQLFDENFHLRKDKRDLEKKVPTEGAVVLSKEDASEYEALKALGKSGDLKTKLEAAGTLETENATLKKKDILRDIASAHGYKLSVLQDLDAKGGGLEYTLKEEKDTKGQARKVAYIKQEGKDVPLEQFATEKWADYMPALKAEQANTQTRPGNGGDPRPSGNAGPSLDNEKKAARASGKYAF